MVALKQSLFFLSLSSTVFAANWRLEVKDADVSIPQASASATATEVSPPSPTPINDDAPSSPSIPDSPTTPEQPDTSSSQNPPNPKELSSTSGALSDFNLRPFSYAILGSISIACLQFL